MNKINYDWSNVPWVKDCLWARNSALGQASALARLTGKKNSSLTGELMAERIAHEIDALLANSAMIYPDDTPVRPAELERELKEHFNGSSQT